MYRCVLGFFQKLARDGDCLMSVGRAFHTRGPATAELALFAKFSPVHLTTKLDRSLDRSRLSSSGISIELSVFFPEFTIVTKGQTEQ